jgi:hypothetical protein
MARGGSDGRRRTEFLIVPDRLKWKVRLESIDSSFCETLEEAIEFAVEGSHAAGKSDFDAEVVVQEPDGFWRSRRVGTVHC